jgi:integrase/recombinase XerD
MQNTCTKDPLIGLKTFFESEGISEVSQQIVEEYMEDMIIGNVKTGTLVYNIKIMKYFLTNVKTDLDKLTIKDCKRLQTALHNKDCAESSKKQFMIGFKRFFHWYGRNKGDRKYLDLADSMKRNFKIDRKVPSDLLTEAEVLDMIRVTSNHRDAALIATLYDSGCRIGELLSCRVKDVEFVNYGCNLTFPKGKTGSRTVLLVFAVGYIKEYLSKHHDKDNPNSSLFITDKKQNAGTKNNPLLKYKPLEYVTIHLIIKDVAKKAGIKKRVYPHLFRHTRATMLAKKLNEPNLRNIFGWASGSNVPSLYIHLSGEDSANAIREFYGLINPLKNSIGIEMGTCVRCKSPVPTSAKLCHVCFTPTTRDAEYELKMRKEEVLSMLANNPDALTEILYSFKK